jgi:hypothetical protein
MEPASTASATAKANASFVWYNPAMILAVSLKDIAAPLVSVVAASLSILFFLLNFRHSKRMADRSLNLEADKMLLDLNRQAIADPSLFALYDDHPVSRDPEMNDGSLRFRAKLEAFAYLHLNIFEIVIFELPEPAYGENRNAANIWCDFFFDTISHSAIMRSILELPNASLVYSPVLISLYNQWKAKSLEVAE